MLKIEAHWYTTLFELENRANDLKDEPTLELIEKIKLVHCTIQHEVLLKYIKQCAELQTISYLQKRLLKEQTEDNPDLDYSDRHLFWISDLI